MMSCLLVYRVSQKNALSECCWSHSALAQSPFAGTPCVRKLIFLLFVTKTKQDQAPPSPSPRFCSITTFFWTPCRYLVIDLRMFETKACFNDSSKSNSNEDIFIWWYFNLREHPIIWWYFTGQDWSASKHATTSIETRNQSRILFATRSNLDRVACSCPVTAHQVRTLSRGSE